MDEEAVTAGMSEAEIRVIGRVAHYGTGPTCEHIDALISSTRALRVRCKELEGALESSARLAHVTYHRVWGKFEACEHSACIRARAALAESLRQ